MKAHMIPCPHQLPTKGDISVSMAKVVLPLLVPTIAFATKQGMKINRVKVPFCSLSSNGVKGVYFQILMTYS